MFVLGLIGLGIATELYQPSPISPNTNKLALTLTESVRAIA
jgi:hypothetical protein